MLRQQSQQLQQRQWTPCHSPHTAPRCAPAQLLHSQWQHMPHSMLQHMLATLLAHQASPLTIQISACT